MRSNSQHSTAFGNLNARPSLRVSAKWSTRSSKDIGGSLSSLPSYIDTHYAYSTSSNGHPILSKYPMNNADGYYIIGLDQGMILFFEKGIWRNW